MSQFQNEGDNKEIGIADISDVTFYFGKSGVTSANDTATDKYFDNAPGDINSVRGFFLRSNQTVQIVSMNDIVFTDPITVVINLGHKETFQVPLIFKMVIRTTVVNTNIKLRWK